MTKDEIINCTDGQVLADAVAVEVMGWDLTGVTGCYVDQKGKVIKDWQPHLPTEKGKAQCWDLMIERKLAVAYDKLFLVSNGCNFSVITDKENLQITALKAVLLSVRSE